jgi:ureidoglycolate lyase
MATAAKLPEPKIIDIPVQRATPEKLAKYGTVLGYDPKIAPMPIDFYDGAAKVRRVAEFKAQGDIEMPIVTLQRRPLEVRWMERHFKHTQTFIPLGGRPFVVVMAPPTPGELPDLDAVRAIRFDGQAGFALKLGTWHEFPFAEQDGTHIVVVLRREASEGLVKENVVQDEARSGDLDKKDLLARCRVRFRLGPVAAG